MPAHLPTDWQEALLPVFSSESFYQLRDFLVQERREYTVFPLAPDVFQALRITPLSRVKVVILGQDPYHGAGQAHGLSFSVRKGMRIPPSLRNIYKELQDDLGIIPPSHGCLQEWAEQGVLLLNAVLTVRSGEANSHRNKGWEQVTDAIIQAVADKDEPVVFILWGSYARQKKSLIHRSHHIIIESAHPSPLSATGFFGTRPFSRANEALQTAGLAPIDWNLSES